MDMVLGAVTACANRTLDPEDRAPQAGPPQHACPWLKYFAHLLKVVARQTKDDSSIHYLKSRRIKLGTSSSRVTLKHKREKFPGNSLSDGMCAWIVTAR